MQENSSNITQESIGHISKLDTKSSNIKLTHVIYGLYAASIILGITILIAIVINYVKREEVAGTFLESHFTWQIKTFWWTVGLAILGIIALFIGVGFLILLGVTIWFVYRIVKGWLRLNDQKPIS